jgi:hypothetical protein
MEGIPSHKQIFLLISTHVSAHIGHHQAVLDEYTSSDGITVNYSASIKVLIDKTGSHPIECYLCISQESPDDGLSGHKHVVN